MAACRACLGTDLIPLLDLGQQPIAHRMLTSPDESEFVHWLALDYCRTCGFSQISDPIPPDVLYLDYNYCFSSWKPQPHMLDELDLMRANSAHGSVFEVGCNDGTFLKLLRDEGFPVVSGVEPNPFARAAAEDHGLTVFGGLLGPDVCREAVAQVGAFEFVVARQVLEHITDLHGYFASARQLLRPDGMLMLELPDFEIALRAGDCSALWEEHVNYFTEPMLRGLLRRMGFELLELRRYNFSGGGMTVLARQVAAPLEDSIQPA
ncbi:MAG TPA: methyltransferase domain-containing protein, partial [Chloroflexota bacterium]|nr:methyltransferase domain-containing protein [Chloroflexota bacterium]